MHVDAAGWRRESLLALRLPLIQPTSLCGAEARARSSVPPN